MTDTATNTATTNNINTNSFPGNWRIAADFDPNQHLMSLKGRDYLNVQNRLLWFVRDQRELIIRGLATTNYVIRTELVEQDRESGYAHFRTYVRDVLGNEATMYGSESVKDFGDYAEKASTKSLGRALLALGYGTGFAPEMDESEERPVDTPVERKRQPAPPAPKPAEKQQPAPTAPAEAVKRWVTPDQWSRLLKATELLDKEMPEPGTLSYEEAETLLHTYMEDWKRVNQKRMPRGEATHAMV